MKKNIMRSIAVLAIVLVAYSVTVFLIPFERTAAFWLAYGFALIAFGVQAYGIYLSFAKGGQAKSKLYGVPVVRIVLSYFVIQLIASLVFMALAAVMPYQAVMIVCVLLLAAALVGAIAADAMREEIERQDAALKTDTQAMRTLQPKMRLLAAQSTEPALKALSEELQYSDPVSSDATADMETELGVLVDELQQAVVDGDQAGVEALCKKAAIVLNERNRMCKLNKK